MEPSLRARVRVGDPDAFSMIFEEHSRQVYNLAVRLTGSWSTAEEAVSLTFLEAWRLRASVDQEGGSLRPWLLGIAINVNRNMTRAARRHQAALSRLPPPPPVADFAEEVAGGHGQSPDQEAFTTIGDLLRAIAPPEISAALFR